MKLADFEKKLVELCGNDTTMQFNYLKKFEKDNIIGAYDEDDVNHEHRWRLFRPNTSHYGLESGIYLTLRCGYGGIYQCYNFWNSETQEWEVRTTDGAFTIMYKDIEPYLN